MLAADVFGTGGTKTTRQNPKRWCFVSTPRNEMEAQARCVPTFGFKIQWRHETQTGRSTIKRFPWPTTVIRQSSTKSFRSFCNGTIIITKKSSVCQSALQTIADCSLRYLVMATFPMAPTRDKSSVRYRAMRKGIDYNWADGRTRASGG